MLDKKFYLSSSIFSSVIVLTFSLFVIIFTPEWLSESFYLSVGLALLICNISSVILIKSSKEYYIPSSILILFALPLILAWLQINFLAYLFLLGYLFLGITILYGIKHLHWKELLISSSIALVVAFMLLADFVNQADAYASFLFKDGLYNASVHIDTLFHMSIANMKENYNIFSLGVHGLVPLKYHLGSHYYLIKVASLFEKDAIFAYNLFYSIVCIPIYLLVWLMCIHMIAKILFKSPRFHSINWFYVIIIFIFFLPARELISQPNLVILSKGESYLISMFLVFAFSNLFLVLTPKKANTILNSLLIILAVISISFTKISTGFIITLLILIILLYRFIFKDNKIQTAILLSITSITFLFIFSLTHEPRGEANGFQLLHFLKNHSGVLVQKGYFYLFYFSFAFIYVWLRTLQLKIYSFKQLTKLTIFELDIIFIPIICLASSVPGLLLNIPGGSAGYFMLSAMHISVVMLLALVISKWKEFWQIIYIRVIPFQANTIFILILILTSIVSISWQFKNTLLLAYHSVTITQQVAKENRQQTNGRTFLIHHLDSLGTLSKDEKQKIAIRISPSDTTFWKHFNQRTYIKSMSFVVPALSGIMQLDGMPPYDVENIENYGFYQYKKRKNEADTLSITELCPEAKKYLPTIEKVILLYPEQQTIQICQCK